MKSLKQKIVYESLRLFSLKGFLSTSIHDILQATNASKGGFYNHFKSKEDLFFAVLEEARHIWREKNLNNLEQIEKPLDKIKGLIRNYRDLYLKDSENFPGGCVFITLSVELNDQRPHLSSEINKGFDGLKRMIKRLLTESKSQGELKKSVKIEETTEMVFAGMLGASVIYGADKSGATLDKSMNALIDYIENLRKK